jgi:hypothetical protein
MGYKNLWAIILLAIFVFESKFLYAQDPFMYPVDEKKVSVQKDIVYKSLDTLNLHFDLYQPSSKDQKRLPVVIIMNGFGNAESKNAYPQVAWAKAIASEGMTAITFEDHEGAIAEDFDDLVLYLKNHSGNYSLDVSKLIVMAFSGHAYSGLPVITDPARKSIRAAVIYYGFGQVIDFKLNMPLLLVRSGRDNPGTDREIDTLVFRAMQHNAPWMVINHHSGAHPFEFGKPDGQSLLVIRQTLSFMHNAISDSLEYALNEDSDLVIASTSLYTGNSALAIDKYQTIIQSDPKNPHHFMRLGQAFAGAARYREALEAFHRSYELGEWGKRDLAVPAALAAARLGDAELTLFWLKILVTAPGGKEIILSERTFDFIRQSPGYKALIKD